MSEIGYDIAHLFGAAVLLTGFTLLTGRRINVMIRLLALQGALIAALATWTAWTAGIPALLITGALTLGLKAVVVPIVLLRLQRRIPPTPLSTVRLAPLLLAALGLTALAILLMAPISNMLPGLAREQLAIALSMIFLALLLMIARGEMLAQVVAVFALENGLILAAVSAAGMPLVVEMCVALALLGMLGLAGLIGLAPREQETVE
ncbi:hydrogenase-4 component E [Lacibacterium aquatile]|uniref:Hydrogenase-4 component E n=1 Tax=Lacibacterium aquatile TaxID=1168082 RepID=A0ABW5DSE4_9PROT